MTPPLPVVMVFAGNDPTGGAGLQADAQTLVSMGCHCAPVVTAITAQDTAGLKSFMSVSPALVAAQARVVLEDMPVTAFKVGMVGSVANARAIAHILADYPDVPAIIDPVFTTGRGDALSEDALEEVFRELLCPRATLLTPNSLEARRLVPEADTRDACGQALLSLGCRYVLISGTHEPTPTVVNYLYGRYRLLEQFSYVRLAGEYHGSGCTLASACAATLAQGLDPINALVQAQEYTYQTLVRAQRFGMGQALPDRFFWARDSETHDE